MPNSLANIERRERLRQLALETIDLQKDPYFMKNHLGTYECKLCLTLHSNEGSYLAHTQGKKHQQNLARRAAKLAQQHGGVAAPALALIGRKAAAQKLPRIGLPEHYAFKIRHPVGGQPGLLFVLKYPRIEAGLQPRTRFMSALEQKVEPANLKYQYVLFAAEPYNTLAFKVPSHPVDKGDGMVLSNWNADTKTFVFQFHFEKKESN
jgi:splicing factor 3A subunit 2